MGCTSSTAAPPKGGEKKKLDASSSSTTSAATREEPVVHVYDTGNQDAIKVLRRDSVRIIQNFARKTIAKTAALKEAHWKVFSDLDSIEEAEMAQLGKFMQILMDEVELERKQMNVSSHLDGETSSDEEDQEDSGRNSERSIGSASLTERERKLSAMSLGDLSVEEVGAHNAAFTDEFGQFEVPKSMPITLGVAADIIEVFRSDGKLSPALLTRIIRRAYGILKNSKTVMRMDIPKGGKVNVVGDLHGNIVDLIHILDECGLPSETNKYIFNGDFVDRGEHGVEVLSALLALLVAAPEHVLLNRGNHEDGPVTTVYGFEGECIRKYDQLMFGLFNEIFRYLPVFIIVSEKIFVVHGGLFHNRAVTIDELESIDRYEYVGDPLIPYPLCAEGLDEDGQMKEYLWQLMRDALWSDTQFAVGLNPSPRGCGVLFGPDVSEEFLRNNHLSMIIRSHECVRNGFFLPYSNTANPAQHHEDTPLLCTIFSASNYTKKGNDGAYMVLMDHPHSASFKIKDTGYYYSVHQYKTSEDEVHLPHHNHTSLHELILKKKTALLAAFEAVDSDSSGNVTRAQWADIMQRATALKIRWLYLCKFLVSAECLSGNNIDYKLFLQKYSVQHNHSSSEDRDHHRKSRNLDLLYGQRKKLELAFKYFDKDNDGIISKQEFRMGCDKLNEHLDSDHKLVDVDHVVDVIDMDNDGSISINEFFEAFRIVDNKVHFMH